MAGAHSEITSPPADEWIERAEQQLRGAGHRSSLPRSAVLGLIARQECVLTAREIADALRGLRPGGRGRDRSTGRSSCSRACGWCRGSTSAALRHATSRRFPAASTITITSSATSAGGSHRSRIRSSSGRSTISGARLDYSVGDHDVILRGSCPDCVAAAA